MNRRIPLLASGLTLLTLLAGCGGTTVPEVAALPSSPSSPSVPASETGVGTAFTPPAADSTGATGEGRPQFRLDDSDDRRTALVNAYSQCLIDHGAVKNDGRAAAVQAVPGGSDGVPLIQVLDPVPAAAKSACASRLPLMPPETEASTNPRFHEQSLAYVACLKKHGEWVQLLNDQNLDWTYVEGHPVPEDNAVFEPTCLLEAFGDGS